MKNIYLAQINYTFSADVPYAYFPYSVGSLWAYANNDPIIADNYSLAKFLYLNENIDAVVNSLDNPYLVGFSIYNWNTVYSLALAEAIKLKWPNCIIVFGGPNVPFNPESWLRYNTFINYAIIQEGEQSFHDLLIYLLDNNYVDITGVCYIKDGEYVYKPAARFLTTDKLISPYTSDLFADVILDAKAKNLILNAVIETDRGCPYQCTFCDWGSLTYQKVKQITLNRVFEEITWCADNKIELVQIANANFGIFINRDNAIVDYICTERVRTGWPKIFDGSWAKDLKPVHVAMVEKLFKHGLFRRFTAAVQSFNQDTLDIIKRKNITNLPNMVSLCREKGIPVSTELLLGLPGETAESFKKGIAYCIENNIVFYTSLLTTLQNSEMNDQDYIDKYTIVTTQMRSDVGYYRDPEYLLTSHSLLSEVEYVDLVIWNLLVTHLYSYRTANHIIDAIVSRGYPIADLLDTIVIALRADSNIKHIIDRYINHVKDGSTTELMVNSITALDIEILTCLYSLSHEQQLSWWKKIANVTIHDIINQDLSINRSYNAFAATYNNKTYTSEPIPARYPNWQTWLITTRWNNNAERQVKENT